MHATLLDQLFDAPRVHRAPSAVSSARRKPDHVASFINGFAKTVDPAKAESFVYRFRPGDAWKTGTFTMKADPLLGATGVMVF